MWTANRAQPERDDLGGDSVETWKKKYWCHRCEKFFTSRWVFKNTQNVVHIFCEWPLPGVVFFKNFLIYYEHKAAVCGILLSLFLQTKTVFLLSPCQSRYLLWFNELSKNRRIQSSFVSRKWRSWVSRFFTYCLINQTQTQWDFCVVGLYNLGLYWKKNSKVYAYKGLVYSYSCHFSEFVLNENSHEFTIFFFQFSYRYVKYEVFHWFFPIQTVQCTSGIV